MHGARHRDADPQISRAAGHPFLPADPCPADGPRTEPMGPSVRSRSPTVKRVRARAICCAAVLVAAPWTSIDRAWAGDLAIGGRTTSTRAAAVEPWSGLLAEASLRTGLPVAWLHDLMHVESGGDATAVSPKGAIGLLQVMPATYAALRRPLGLGADPFAPRDNLLAGGMYLRLLVDRYGWPGALAAYNAGPGRLDAFLTRGRALPTETTAYLLRFASSHAVSAVGVASVRVQPTSNAASGDPPPSLKPTLFVAAASAPSAVPPASANAVSVHDVETATWRDSGLFVPSNGSRGRR